MLCHVDSLLGKVCCIDKTISVLLKKIYFRVA